MRSRSPNLIFKVLLNNPNELTMKRFWWRVYFWMQSLLLITAAQAAAATEADDPTTGFFDFSNDIATASLQHNPTKPSQQRLQIAQQPLPPAPTPTAPVVPTQPSDESANANNQPQAAPGFSIFNPVGFGADNNLVFFSASYQNRTRFTRLSDGEAGFGIGFGNAVNAIGAELSYSINSFGTSSGFGSGAFNIKLHKRLSEDTAVAIGWNQFLQIKRQGGNSSADSDYPRNSYYATATKIFRTREDLDTPFSRVAVTAGVGSGVFLRFDPALTPGDSRGGLNVFGSIGVRVAKPISAVLEWTGQDLAAGLSIAPFENFPLVITPAIRDIAGAGDGARFVLGTGVAFQF
jgi:hypothetical protein